MPHTTLLLDGFLIPFSYTTQTLLPRLDTTHSGLGHPKSTSNRENAQQTCLQMNLMKTFAQLLFFLLSISRFVPSWQYQPSQCLPTRCILFYDPVLPTPTSTQYIHHKTILHLMMWNVPCQYLCFYFRLCYSLSIFKMLLINLTKLIQCHALQFQGTQSHLLNDGRSQDLHSSA